MTAYKDMTLDQRRAEYAALQTAFADLKAQGLKLDMTRGKPCKDQLDMVSDIFDMLKEPEDYIVDGIDIRNYGALSGLPEAKRLFANLLDCKPKQVFVGGNASLQLMYGVIDFYRAAKAAGAKIILLTHYEDSPGAKLADIVLLCGAQESPLDSGNIPVKVALLYVAEVLVLRYTMDDPENANAAQDRTSEALAVKML